MEWTTRQSTKAAPPWSKVRPREREWVQAGEPILPPVHAREQLS